MIGFLGVSCQYLMERFPVEEERPSDTAVEEEPPSNTAAENLAIIHGGPNRAETRQRFEFVLPRLARTCSDTETEVNVADMLAVMNKMIQDAGLGTEEGGLLGFTDAVYSLTMQVGSGAEDAVACAELWAMYVSLRQGGFAKEQSVSDLVGIVGTFR